MSQKDKLIARFLQRPTDFSFADLETMLRFFGYERNNKGRTSGSRVEFTCDGKRDISVHRPHSKNGTSNLRRYHFDQIIEILEGEDLL